MSATDSGDGVTGFYERQIGRAQTADEVYGYLVFVAGLVLGIVGILLFLPSESAGSLREYSVALGAAGFALLIAGPVIRLPLRRAATIAVYLGVLLCAAAIAWFLVVFPSQWQVATGHQGVISLYVVGIAIVGAGGVLVPLLTSTRTTEEAAAARERSEESQRRVEEVESELEAAERARDELEREVESIRTSQAQFELFEDKAGEFRWRLRHRNGNVIADSGEGYTAKHNAQKGMQSVRRNALGAASIHADDPAVEDESDLDDLPMLPDEAEQSQATFEVFEDEAGEYRWRLVHDNGNILADSGEGYTRRRDAERAIDGVRNNAGPAEYLTFDPTSFEIYRDVAGEWRWRLVHKNGNILADGGEGYSRRRDARRAVDRLQDRVGDADFDVYEDDAGEYRWRLRAENGNVVADSSEGYTRRGEAEDATERVSEYAPDADALDVGFAAFEVYEDAGGEWRWRLRHRNGNIIGDGGEGYSSRTKAHDAIESVKRDAPGAAVETE
ncbi:HVO_2922 family protein [Halobacterium sp. NMX12-1]|uniref:HVO_2922 family protein n=1 Tax=Halobacterium sp. NMX12-1 TaxID=3166650 RepID=A0AAU8CA31_9EURY